MTIAGHDIKVIKDVFVGEVWVCSGQSNMEWSLERAFEPSAYHVEVRGPRVILSYGRVRLEERVSPPSAVPAGSL